MNINLVNPIGVVHQANALGQRRNVHAAEEPASSFAHTEALNTAMAGTPGIRSEVVERARQLVSQETYPPQEIQRRIAQLLAVNLEPES